MIVRRILCFLLFIFFIWLALATRRHPGWFPPLLQEYGGDVIWAGAFLFLMRSIFIKAVLWKLALASYLLGVADEFSQLLQFRWLVAARETYIGRLMLGVGFVWSDILCYAIGIALAALVIVILERYVPARERSA